MTNMIQPLHRISVLLIVALLVSACGSAPPRLPVALERAKKSEQSAYRAMREGDLLRARELFGQAEVMYQALEDTGGAATAAINLATVQHRLGNDDEALQSLERIIADPNRLIAADLQATAAFRKAVILADLDKTDEAGAAINRARELCTAECPWLPGINNLQARLLLKQGEYLQALSVAGKVVHASAQPDEMANALRITASAELATNLLDHAFEHFNAALQLDKGLALGTRIAEDLEGLAQVLQMQGKTGEAGIYARRAGEVREALTLIKANPAARAIP